MADPFNQDPYNLTTNPLTGGGTYGEGRVSDALQRLRGLQGALQSGQIDFDTYNKLFQQFDPQAQQLVQQIGGGGSKSATAANNAGAGQFGQLSNLGGQDLSTFANQFKNLTGQNAGGQDFTNYFSNVGQILGSGPQTYADTNTAINQYLQNTYQPQIQKYQQQQQTSALDTAQKQAQDLIGQQNQQTINQLTSPQVQEQFKNAYNRNGMLDSGAFSQGLGDTLANAASGNISSALGNITLPGITGIENTYNAPYQNFLGNQNQNLQNYGQEQNQYNQFNLQKQLAEELGGGGQSDLQQWMPLLQGLVQGGAQGGASATSYICLELIKRGFATQYDLDMLHYEGMPAVFKKARAFYFYAQHGKELVDAANRKGIDWKPWAKRFLGDVIGVGDPVKAVNLYAKACKDLAMLCAPKLWDERVMRTSFIDSLLFIPRLLFHGPYIKALLKTTWMRMHFILDMPREI